MFLVHHRRRALPRHMGPQRFGGVARHHARLHRAGQIAFAVHAATSLYYSGIAVVY